MICPNPTFPCTCEQYTVSGCPEHDPWGESARERGRAVYRKWRAEKGLCLECGENPHTDWLGNVISTDTLCNKTLQGENRGFFRLPGNKGRLLAFSAKRCGDEKQRVPVWNSSPGL
jgi:hypothetical protein